MKITSEQLKKMMPTCKDPSGWAMLLSDNLEKYGIVSSQQTAYFIAQCGHESGDFNVLVENLNYGAPGLLKTFSKYFGNPPKADANAYARKPEKIASLVYANRMGNGPESSGDGWKYRGKGLIQITGYENHKACSQFIYGDDTLIAKPDLLFTSTDAALESALWFWDKNKLTSVTDFVALTKKINGGINGLDDRLNRLKVAQSVLG
jgi:putative chitinase